MTRQLGLKLRFIQPTISRCMSSSSGDKNGENDSEKVINEKSLVASKKSDKDVIELPPETKCLQSLHKTREEIAKIPYTSKLVRTVQYSCIGESK